MKNDINNPVNPNEDWMGFIAGCFFVRVGSGLGGSIRKRIEDMLQMMRLWQVNVGFGQSLAYF